MPVLNGLPPATFLRDHWQKRPLLIRQALPGFSGIVGRDALLRLATRPDAISRLIIQYPQYPRRRARWERHDGPFAGLDASMLPATHWTLLVHGIESLVPGGWEILRRFSFLPAARIDDLMVSYAADGGGVGPHDDLYDVFLLQGPGQRRWQVSRQRDRTLDPNAAVKVLRSFVPEHEWLLEPGDMLYLPPGVAHRGVAVGPCFTYSIGFLAPTHAELVQNFLEYLGATLGARIAPDARYRDPNLRATARPQEISAAMLAAVADVLGGIRIPRAAFSDFLGRFLTRPKPQVRFVAPRPMTDSAFGRRLRARGTLALALASRGLGYKGRLFLNGHAFTPRPSTARRLLLRLFQERALTLPLPTAVPSAAVELLHTWYSAGYVTLA